MLFDQQFQVLREVVASSYRLRNGAREIRLNNSVVSQKQRRLFVEQFKEDARQFFDIIYEARSILPQDVFAVIHDYKGLCRAFEAVAETSCELPKSSENDSVRKAIEQKQTEIDSLYQDIDESFGEIAFKAQANLNVRNATGYQHL